MIHTVGIRELRQQVSGLLRRVAAGETIEITDHGHPVARVVPLRHGSFDQLVAEGRVSLSEVDLLEAMDAIGLPGEAPPDLSPSEALALLRSGER